MPAPHNSIAPLTIRDATPSDVPRLGRVHHESWMAAYTGVMDDAFLATLSPTTFEGYARARFEHGRVNDDQPYLVAETASEGIIGFTRAGPTRDKSPTGDALPEGFAARWSSELYAIYVLRKHWGTGVGRALLHATIHRLLARGHTSLCLWVLTGNTAGRRFYERLGGQPAGNALITLGGRAYPQVAYGWHDLHALAATAGAGTASS